MGQKDKAFSTAPVVTNNQDPHDRVKVYLPQLHEPGSEGVWSGLVSLYAGGDLGLLMIPEIDDEVLVGFENGDLSKPIVIGVLHSRADDGS